MKIGILTLPLHTNYGGLLQAYALQTVLERMGHEVEHLQPKVIYPRYHHIWAMPMVWVKRSMRKFLGGEWRLPIFQHPRKWIRKHTDKFIRQYINCRCLGNEDWTKELAMQYDVLVVGSDQVWRTVYAYPFARYFADFASGTSVRRISYAASFGVAGGDLSREQIAACKPLLQDFDAVSVRESSAVMDCKNLFDVQAKQVLDPTLLLSKEDYMHLFSKNKRSHGNLMVYVLDESSFTEAIISRLARDKGLKPFRTNSLMENIEKRIEKVGLTKCQQPPLEQWLRGFYDADYVVTDSFHACVFSIIFQKQFICLGNQNRGMERFHSLLDSLGLSDRLISAEDFSLPDTNINWKDVNERLEQMRISSRQFLAEALGC